MTPYINGDYEQPAKPSLASFKTETTDPSAPAIDRKAFQEAREEYDKWLLKDAKARIIIENSIPKHLVKALPRTAKEQYDFLTKRFSDDGPSQKQSIFTN